jgi:NAD(P)-dependent dehydrogenase (short-subunit alcohol dehydrogenase family)
MKRLQGKRCLLVGGTGGIGKAAARRFLEEGAVVVLASPENHSPDAFAPAEFLCCDATDPVRVQRLIAAVVRAHGGLDVLYHIAGGSGRKDGDGSLHDCTDAGWRATLDANLTSTFHTNRAAVRYFLSEKRPGVILNMASVLALSPAPRFFDTCAYAAAKGGVVALSRQAAARYAADGIRVNVLAPGLIDTPMSARAVGDPAVRAYLQGKQPLRGGPGAPEDLSDAAVFLCSDEARFVTGVVFAVDGGWCVSEAQEPIRKRGQDL